MIVWKFDEREQYCRFVLHKVRVQALAFSPSDRFLATLGGLDDGRWALKLAMVLCMRVQWLPASPPPSVVIWNLETREALCGSPAATQSVGQVYCLAFANSRDDLFVTGGK